MIDGFTSAGLMFAARSRPDLLDALTVDLLGAIAAVCLTWWVCDAANSDGWSGYLLGGGL